ncbi:hypothetical protein [Streptomyces cyaneofuscatus]|uniref:hypothetical protein n=1 Tax=Streptomyces cyaneofuscatus TaxID=66883 RepID=UPI003666BBC4
MAAATSGAATALAVGSLLHRRRDIEEDVAAASPPTAPDGRNAWPPAPGGLIAPKGPMR